MSPSFRSLIAAFVLASASAAARTDAPAPIEVPETPNATITISGGIVALGVGYEWARGTLAYQGQKIPFWVRGVSVVDIGAAKIAGAGEVFNLKSLADFEGNYAGSTFGSAVSRGTSLALLKNENGVVIRARSTVSGVRLNFSGNDMRIRFTAPAKTADTPASGSVGTPSAPSLEVKS